MQGQKISRLALAVTISFSGTLFSSLAVAETSWNKDISIENDKTINDFTNGSILDKNNGTSFIVDGKDHSVTLVGQDAGGNSGNMAFRATSDVTFNNFSELTIKGNGDTKQTFWVSSSANGPAHVQFGEGSKAIGILNIENFTLGHYFKGEHLTEENKNSGSLTFYADNLNFKNSDINVDAYTLSVNKTGAENQSTSIDGNLNVHINDTNNKTAKFEVLGGNFKVQGITQSTNNGQIILGNTDYKLGTVSLSDVNVNTEGTLSIVADSSSVGNVSVSGEKSDFSVYSGDFQASGDITLYSSGVVNLGKKEQILSEVNLQRIYNSSSEFNVEAGSLIINGNDEQRYAIYTTGEDSKVDIKITGKTEVKKGIEAYQNATVKLASDEVELNDLLRVDSSSSINVIANLASLVGQADIDNGRLSFANADGSMMERLSITDETIVANHQTLEAGANSTIDIKAKNLLIKGNMVATGDEANIEVTATDTIMNISGAQIVSDNGEIHFNDAGENQKLTINSSNSNAILTSKGGNFIVDNGSVDITGTVQANGKGNINFGSKDHLLSDITITDNAANAVRSNGGSVNLYAESVDITGNNGAAVEVFNLGRNDQQEDEGVMNIYASDNLNISGNIVVGKDAGQQNVSDYTNDNAALNIGTLNDDTVVMIDGDVTVYNRSNDEGELKTNNIANISLGNKNSEFTGSINDYVIESSGAVTASSQDNVGTNLNLGEATWNVTDNSTVGAVNAENGYIDAQQSKVKIKKLTGAGALFAINQIVSDEEEAQVQIESGEAGTEVSSYFAGNIGDELAAGQISEQDIVNSSAQIKNRATDANHGNLYLDGGWISGNKQYTWDDAKNTYFLTSQEENLFSTGNIDLAKINAVAWRNELTSLTDRMSTLRTAPEFAGVWARYKGGEWDGDSINQQFNGVEVGVDKAINQNFVVGLAASYIEGNGDLDNGSADTDSYSGAAYLSYYNSGWFVDVMGKLGKIETDFDLNYNGLKDSGDYTMSGYLFGVETGYRFNFNNFYVEPQVQLTYSYLGSKEFTTDNRTIDFETLESLIGRVGFMSGYDFGDIGSAYLRASYYHDFDGDVDMRVGHNDLFVTESDELNSDWGDVGIGANVNFGEATLFFDVSRSFGGDIDLEWKANAGARYMF